MSPSEVAAQHIHPVAQTSPAGHPVQTIARARRFLTQSEFEFIEAAAARLIPADELGPGAKEAGAAWFIDGQLESSWGTMGRQYRQGPWPESVPQQGYQLPHTPQDVYRAGIRDTNAYCEKRYGKTFDRLAGTEQDEVLRGLEAGKLELPGVPARSFRHVAHQYDRELCRSDGGGNRDKVGWKLVGFPESPPFTRALSGATTSPTGRARSILDVETQVAELDEHGHPKHVRLSAKD
jgi:gluconate 2-dehydrogenase gamma chain